AVFADGVVRYVPQRIDDEELWFLFSGQGPEPTWRAAWYELLFTPPICRVLTPAVVFSVIAAAGVAIVLHRAVQRHKPSPGELLWFIMGAQQLVFLIVLTLVYERELLEPVFQKSSVALWLWPRLAGCVAAVIAFWQYRHSPGWAVLFFFLIPLLGAAALDAANPHEQNDIEHACVIMAAPFVMGVAGIFAACMGGFATPAQTARPRLHRVGILIAIVPLIW